MIRRYKQTYLMKNIANSAYTRRLQFSRDKMKKENKIHKKKVKMFSSPNTNRVPRKIKNTKRISKIQWQIQSKIAKAFRVSYHKAAPIPKPQVKLKSSVIWTYHARYRAWERWDCCTMDFRKTWRSVKLQHDWKYRVTTTDWLKYIVAKDEWKFIVVTII